MSSKIRFLFFILFFIVISCAPKDENREDDPNWIHVDDISVHFSPNNNLEIVLVKLLQSAKESIDMAIYDLTNEFISEALIKAHNNGIAVRVYCDKNINPDYEQPLIDKMREAGITVYIANTKNWTNVESFKAIMHNKFIIVDQETILTGSYNFSKNAENNNRENFIIIKNPLIALKYQEAFDGYWLNP
jgi:phosphatidylserine/phosphatidylglycerophosphate/cardiolipin synthase-like enzyme